MPSRAVALLVGVAFSAVWITPARAVDTIHATSTATLSQDAGFVGLYKYTVHVSWSLDEHDLGHLDLFLNLGTFDDTCSGASVEFPAPAGTSTGENGAGVCILDYRGEFLCKTDPSLNFQNLGATVKYEPIEVGCSSSENGSGTFYFYSRIKPALSGLYPGAVAIKHGTEVDFGDLSGSLPLGPGRLPAAAIVAINEFLAVPPRGVLEFIEIYNTTGATIDISGWSLCASDNPFTRNCIFFPNGRTIPPGGFILEPPDSFFAQCDTCFELLRPERPEGRPGPPRTLFVENLLPDPGGFITLKDSTTPPNTIDSVAYGTLGGAPVSIPLLVPEGYSRPPGFSPGTPVGDDPQRVPSEPGAAPETLATSTNRVPDGNDTDQDSTDFNLGSPTPNAANTATSPELGTSVRINKVFIYPPLDGLGELESVELINTIAETKDVGDYYLSEGGTGPESFLRPLFGPDVSVPLEGPSSGTSPSGSNTYRVFNGKNGYVGNFREDGKIELYESGPSGLVKLDGFGWAQSTGVVFLNQCLIRDPAGVGPAGGWDWSTSGGDDNLKWADCLLQAGATTDVVSLDSSPATLLSPSPNPFTNGSTLGFVIGSQAGATAAVRLVVYDVAGRRVSQVATGDYPPGRYAVTWNGASDDGIPVGSGVYFARLYVSGRPAGEERTLIRIAR